MYSIHEGIRGIALEANDNTEALMPITGTLFAVGVDFHAGKMAERRRGVEKKDWRELECRRLGFLSRNSGSDWFLRVWLVIVWRWALMVLIYVWLSIISWTLSYLLSPADTITSLSFASFRKVEAHICMNLCWKNSQPLWRLKCLKIFFGPAT